MRDNWRTGCPPCSSYNALFYRNTVLCCRGLPPIFTPICDPISWHAPEPYRTILPIQFAPPTGEAAVAQRSATLPTPARGLRATVRRWIGSNRVGAMGRAAARMHRHRPPAPRARPGRTRNRPPADVARRPRRARPRASMRSAPPPPRSHRCAAARGGGGRPSGDRCPPYLRLAHITAPNFEHRSGQYPMDEIRGRFQASARS